MVVEAQQAEKYGFDSFFVTEHHQEPSGYLPSPLPLLAALAARTSTIRLGTGIAVLPLYHPVRMAEDCAVIDIISKGRLILGVGMGYQDVDFAAYGLRVSERVSLFEEGVEIIKRAWTEEKLSFVGKRYTLTNISVTPKPVQQPRPPIWVAAVGDEAMKRAGRVGDALLADSFQLPARLKRRVDLYRQTAASRGNRAQVVLFREGFVARTRDEAVCEYEAALLSTHRYYWRHGSYYQDIKKEENLDLKRISLDRLIMD
jgi:probable F420-dependent oxidoreductase